MKKNKFAIILMLLISNCLYVSGQKLIVLENKITMKRIRFYENDIIRIKSKYMNKSYNGFLNTIKDSSIIVNGNEIPLSDVGTIVIDRVRIQKLSMITGFSGLIYGSLGILNNLIDDETPIISNSTTIGSGGLLGITAILYPFRRKNLKINRGWNVMIVNLSN